MRTRDRAYLVPRPNSSMRTKDFGVEPLRIWAHFRHSTMNVDAVASCWASQHSSDMICGGGRKDHVDVGSESVESASALRVIASA